MTSLDASLITAPASVRADAMEAQVEFLKTLDPSSETTGYGPGLHQLDDVAHHPPSSSNALPGQTQSTFPPAAQAGCQYRGRELYPKRRQEAAAWAATPHANIPEVVCPPMPPSFAYGKQRGGNKTDPEEYWNFCFREMHYRGKAMGYMELGTAFDT